MREGSLDAPTRHAIAWKDEAFYDEEKLDVELRRQFDVCHGCRRCFNLCDSFPRLFDLVDEAGDAELEGVSSDQLKTVVDACTLCDMCFLTKCPYVPPHEFNLDIPHLMVRHRAVQNKRALSASSIKNSLKPMPTPNWDAVCRDWRIGRPNGAMLLPARSYKRLRASTKTLNCRNTAAKPLLNRLPLNRLW